MKREEIESQLRKIVAELLGIDESLIEDDTHFINDLAADSLDSVEVIMMVEDKFDLSIAEEEADMAFTFKLLADLIENKMK